MRGEFYATGLGRLTVALLRQKLRELWPDCAGLSVLGLGYTGPYLQLWREQAARCIAVSPQQMGLAPWPLGRASLACLSEEDALPFPDLLFDRILLVHGFEQADNARRLLREVWRLLKDDGRLIIVVPNRRGLWAYAEEHAVRSWPALFRAAIGAGAERIVFQGRDQGAGFVRAAAALAPLGVRPVGAHRRRDRPAILGRHHRRGQQGYAWRDPVAAEPLGPPRPRRYYRLLTADFSGNDGAASSWAGWSGARCQIEIRQLDPLGLEALLDPGIKFAPHRPMLAGPGTDLAGDCQSRGTELVEAKNL